MARYHLVLLFNLIIGNIALGQDITADTVASKEEMPQVSVVAYKDKLLSKVPGSVSVVKYKEIQALAPISGNDIMRRVPGLNVVDEEGAGLRINIGVRGLDPDRSRNLLVLEDGVPVALNPYGEPEMYFTPVIDKVRAVELLKGSGQILFGPQTIGGVVNFITANPPSKPTTELRIKGGQGGFFSGYASHGNTKGNVGYVVSYLRKQADNIGPTWFHINDFSGKVKIRINEKSSVGIKMGVYDELSNSTYIGITQTMYDQGKQDQVRMAPDDRMPVRRYNLSITHQAKFSENLNLQTTAFAYTTTRNWQRQDFSSIASAANQTGVVWGDGNVAGGAVYMLRTNGHRNRQFEVMGVEPRLTLTGQLRNMDHKLQTGVRFLYEKANEQFIIGNKPDAVAGNMRDNEIRSGKALSAYVQEEISLTKKLTLNAGVRLGQFDYNRNILRGRFPVNGANVTADTNVLAGGNVFSLIPGGGLSFEASPSLTFFAGVHKGFAPPRTKDAITAEGMPLQLDEESSWNYEAGARFGYTNWLSGEATLFMMNFSNQIIPISQSSGNANATGLANGGRTRHQGVEGALLAELGKAFNWKHNLTLGTNLTYVRSQFMADRFIPKGAESINVKGNKLPYAPSLMWNGQIGFEMANGPGIRIFANHVSEQFADELNSIAPSADGRTGRIESRMVMDATAWYALPGKKITFNISAKNITNERYIVSRRPQGIRVGLPTMITAGIDIVL